jgi:hypothetical protein
MLPALRTVKNTTTRSVLPASGGLTTTGIVGSAVTAQINQERAWF